MIPEQLHIKNFLSHRETDLDLRGVHVASLIGDNGAGKSALLDAMTWAVWGQSRAPYGREDDLIFHGEDGMEVEYVFIMPYQGGMEQRFRILRRREQRGRRTVNTQLDFQIEGEAGWRILTANSVRETQNRIEEHLGLDYETFINSAYLRQGHADEFTIQTPAQRKRVLSAVLGLDVWDVYQERAKTTLSEFQGELRALNTRLEEIDAELSHKSDYEAELVSAEQDMEQAEQHLSKVQAQVDELTRAREKDAGLHRQIADLDTRIQQESALKARLEAELEQLHERSKHYDELFANADNIEQQYRLYQELLSIERGLGEKLGQSAKLQEKKAEYERQFTAVRETLVKELRDSEAARTELERKVQVEQAKLERERGELLSQIKLLEERLPGESVKSSLDAAQSRLAEYEQMNQELETYLQALRENEVEQGRLQELNRQYRTQMDEAKIRIKALEEVDAACPLCGQPLTKEHRQQLLGEINNSGHSLGDIHRHNTTRLQTLLDEQKLLQANINSLEIDLKLRPAQEKLVARLQQQIEQGNDAQERIIALHTQLQTLEKILVAEQYAEEERQVMQSINEDIQDVQQQIDGQQYAPEIKKAMQAVAVEFGTIGYDAAYHEEVKAQVQALFPIEEQHRELGNARADSQRDIEMQNRLSADIEGQKARLHALENAYLKCQEELNELQSVLSKGDMLAQLLNESRQTAVNTRQHMGAVKQNLAAMQTLEKRGNELREKRVELAHSTAIYTEIRDACGVNGIPAMIIEHTLPELEREANKILQQLTGGRMHVRFETQRETKSGTLRETLDIIISDEKGTRPYENFSGGEQFRVNFAIRVALSRLLARRSGVRLRSLFVDEGFGSLDADGRQRLVEAIKTVQDSFHLILVITHIDELREAFPTQILVSKSDAGSLVEVV